MYTGILQMNIRLRTLRREKGYTQEFLAKKIGVSQTVISKIERGSQIPDAYLIRQLSDVFQVSTDYILHKSEYRYSADELFPENLHRSKVVQHPLQLLERLNMRQKISLEYFLRTVLFSQN